jgi:hypothetical protein
MESLPIHSEADSNGKKAKEADSDGKKAKKAENESEHRALSIQPGRVHDVQEQRDSDRARLLLNLLSKSSFNRDGWVMVGVSFAVACIAVSGIAFFAFIHARSAGARNGCLRMFERGGSSAHANELWDGCHPRVYFPDGLWSPSECAVQAVTEVMQAVTEVMQAVTEVALFEFCQRLYVYT